MITTTLPKLITFDGEARSGKGTVVQATKDYLRDKCGYKVMLIDAGQVFRVLVVGGTRAGIDLDDPAEIDKFLADESEAEKCVQLVKQVYRMSKDERDALLYSNEVGANSAKFGARPASQSFKDNLLRKWLGDAASEGYQIVLLDGRALVETGKMLEDNNLCDFVLGYYFICDSVVGAKRTLGFAANKYDDLSGADRRDVDELVAQMDERNRKDRERKVQPITSPTDALTWQPKDDKPKISDASPAMFIIDTSAEISKQAMTTPIAEFTADVLIKISA